MVDPVKEEAVPPAVASGAGRQTAMPSRLAEPFQPGASWRIWIKQFEISLKLHRISDDSDKALLFLRNVGDSNFMLLESLLEGKELTSVPYKELVETMERHFTPKKLKWAERYRMRQMSQEPGESLQSFFARLQKAANDCGYGKDQAHRDDGIIMQFIVGMRSVETRRRLLEKEDLTTKKALEVAEAFESAGDNAAKLDLRIKDAGIGKVTSDRNRSGEYPRGVKDFGKTNQGQNFHGKKSFAPKGYVCYGCGGAGHRQFECPSKARNNKSFGQKKAWDKGSQKSSKSKTHRRTHGSRPNRVHYCDESENSDDDVEHIDYVSCHWTPRSRGAVTTGPSRGPVGNGSAPRSRGVARTPRSRGAVITGPSCGPVENREPPRSRVESKTPRRRGVVAPGPSCGPVESREPPRSRVESKTLRRRGVVVPGPSCGPVESMEPPRSRGVSPTPRSRGAVCPCLNAPQCGGEAETPCAQGAVATGHSGGSVGNENAPRRRGVAETPRSGGAVALSKVNQTETVGRVTQPACMLSMTMNGVAIRCELDTGASCSIIDTPTWELMGKPKLEDAFITAKGYNGGEIPFRGQCLVDIRFAGKSASMRVHVGKAVGHNICGRDMIRVLKIDCGPHYREVCEVNQTGQVDPKRELAEMLEQNKELFKPGLGRCTKYQASLKFKEDKPVPRFCRVRPIPFAVRGKVEEVLEKLVASGTLRPVEHSQWGTPLVVVPKPGGKVRVCGDYKVTVNSQLDINQYPLPIPDELFHMLNGGKKFSKMDLSDAYMQLELDEESRKYTTINTHKGMFEYTRMPFGVASAPAIFQKTMEQTLAGIPGVLVYLDDITVTGPDDKTHLENLRKVLSRLKEAGFRLKQEKCEFLKEKMEFLGHVVDADGIRPSPEKLKAMVNMPEPKNLKEVESFIGMVQYYGKFIPGLSTLAAPLNALRKKDVKFTWDVAQKDAFKSIKQKLLAMDLLTHYDPKTPVVLATDASEYGLGAVVYHKYDDGREKVIAYASRSLTKEERNYAQIEKEALGIVYGVEKFSQFLYGRKFTLLTDHQPLVRIFGPKHGLPVIAVKRLHRWAIRLMVYSFDIEYRRTTEFGNADGLSRLPDPHGLPNPMDVIRQSEINEVRDETLKNTPFTEQEVAKATASDLVLQKVLKYEREGWPEKVKQKELQVFWSKREEFVIHKGCLLWGKRIVVPSTFKKKVLAILHSSHYGQNKMVSLARSKVWYPAMDHDIRKMAASCETCAVYGKDPVRAPLHPWEEPSKPWQRIHMDFCETKGGSRWLIVVDAKSKWPEAIKMGSTTTEATIKKLQTLFTTHGLPEQIVSDNGPQFASKEFQAYCESRNIEVTYTPPYHPNSNGAAERFVQTFKQGFYKGTREGKTQEDTVNELLFQYRVTPHPATGRSPGEVLMGRALRTTLDVIKTEKKKCPVSKYQENMSKWYGGSKKEKVLKVGQEVYLRNHKSHGEKWIPAIITQKIGSNVYMVHYGSGETKAHADQLKKRVTIRDEVETWIIPSRKADNLPGRQAQKRKSNLQGPDTKKSRKDVPVKRTVLKQAGNVPLRRSTRLVKNTLKMAENKQGRNANVKTVRTYAQVVAGQVNQIKLPKLISGRQRENSDDPRKCSNDQGEESEPKVQMVENNKRMVTGANFALKGEEGRGNTSIHRGMNFAPVRPEGRRSIAQQQGKLGKACKHLCGTPKEDTFEKSGHLTLKKPANAAGKNLGLRRSDVIARGGVRVVKTHS